MLNLLLLVKYLQKYVHDMIKLAARVVKLNSKKHSCMLKTLR